MSDNLPGRSRSEGAGHPLSKAEFVKRERARKALDIWIETQSYAAVRTRLKLRSNEVARQEVLRGEALYLEEERDATTRHIAAQQRRLYEIIAMSKEAGDWSAVDREMKAWDRLSKLLGLDAVRESDGGGPSFTINVGLPEHIGREPVGELPDVIEGTIVEEGPG